MMDIPAAPVPEPKPRAMVGTPLYDNWRAFCEGETMQGESEYLLYTDARLTGGAIEGLGPYASLNMTPSPEMVGRVRASFVLRFSGHVTFDLPEMNKTEQSRYHGGSAVDEIAALASLKCGVRLKVGGLSRWFIGGPEGTASCLE